jgi:glycolate oxidase
MPPGYDLLGVICGSEGQLGVVTEATLRILPKPEGARPVLMGFDSSEVAGACVADIIKAGVLPVAIEFMDRPCIRADGGLRQGRLPGRRGAADRRGRRLRGRDRRAAGQDQRHRPKHNPVRAARSAVGRSSPRHLEGPQIRLRRDGPDQRLHLPRRHHPGEPAARWCCAASEELSKEYGLDVANVFHAGDGNMHPLILFDANKPGDLEPARRWARKS